MSNSLVSVIVPTKNSSQFLRACLESIKNQNYKNIELIVVDNFSTDETQAIARNYTSKFFIKGPERSAQRNFGAKNSKGNYLFFIDSDMELEKQVIQECLEKINDGGLGLIVPEKSFGVGFWAQCKELERSFYVGVDWIEAARFFRKDAFKSVGGYNQEMISGEDWDLSQRIEKKGRIDRINAFIYHNEGKLNLFKLLKKKYYYGKHFELYVENNKKSLNHNRQSNLLNRYTIFFCKPVKLFENPFLGIGMLFMKTCEFIFGGIGFLAQKIT